MKSITVGIPENEAYIISLGDIHLGSIEFTKDGEKQLKKDLTWLKEHPNARAILNGDVFNCASRISKTSPFTSNSSEYDYASKLLKPYANQILLVTDGNHEARFLDMFGVSPCQWLARDLNIYYCGWSVILNLKVGKRPKNRWYQNYYLYIHHIMGGGETVGGKLNRVTKLRDLVEGIDCYIGNHTHQSSIAPMDVFCPSKNKEGFKKRVIYFVNSGGYVSWNNSYAEQKMLPPANISSCPKIKFNAHGGAISDHKIEVVI